MTTVTIRNTAMYVIGAKPTLDITGQLTKLPKWCPPDSVALIRDSDGGLSIISPKSILAIDGKKYKAVLPKINTWKVSGSKGSTYVVTESNGHYSCTCTGFQFRKSCKHLGMIK